MNPHAIGTSSIEVRTSQMSMTMIVENMVKGMFEKMVQSGTDVLRVCLCTIFGGGYVRITSPN